MIISKSYFKGIIKIPNSTDTAPNSNLLGNGKELDLFIDEFEREVLIKSLGYSLFNDFINELDNDEPNGLKPTADLKWDYLLNGREYKMRGQTVRWPGLRFKDGIIDRSLIAYYVFCQFLNSDIVNYSGIGVVKEKGKNSSPATSDPLYVASWRKFFELTEFSRYNTGLRSLYDFIQDMNMSGNMYLNWIPNRFENMNIFGI